MRLRGIQILLALLATVQLVQFANWSRSSIPFLERQRILLEGRSSQEDRSSQASQSIGMLSIQVDAWRDIGELRSAIPGQQRLLVLTSNPFNVRYDYLLMPHDAHLLISHAEQFLELAAQQHPKRAREIGERLTDIRRFAQDLTPERLRSELTVTNWVITYQFADPFPPESDQFEQIAIAGDARLFHRIGARLDQ